MALRCAAGRAVQRGLCRSHLHHLPLQRHFGMTAVNGFSIWAARMKQSEGCATASGASDPQGVESLAAVYGAETHTLEYLWPGYRDCTFVAHNNTSFGVRIDQALSV